MNLNILTKVDTPTISNALDLFRGDRSAEGFTKFPVVCSNEKLKPIVGIAKTAKIKASIKSSLTPEKLNDIRLNYYEYMSINTDKSFGNICVIEDLDWPNPVGAFWGEVNVSLHKGLNLKGTLTNGLLRDLGDIDNEYMVLASAIGPSHAYVHVVEYNSDVNLFGLKIKPNDIIHADRHGAVIIPREALKILPEAIQFMKEKEEILIKASKEKDFNFDKLKFAWKKANSMIFKS